MATNIATRTAFRYLWTKYYYGRSIYTANVKLLTAEKNEPKPGVAPKVDEAPTKPLIGSTYRPTNFERKLLVWTKRYASDNEIPKFVPHDQMERARNLFRIYGMIGMMVVTLFACIAMIQSGKRAYERGESLTKMNVEWHKREKETNEK